MVKSLAKNPRTWDSGMIRRNKVQKIINKNIEIQHGYPQTLSFLKNKTCPIQHFRFLGILDHFIQYISDTVYFYHINKSQAKKSTRFPSRLPTHVTAEVEASVVFSLYGGDSTDGGDKLVNNR